VARSKTYADGYAAAKQDITALLRTMNVIVYAADYKKLLEAVEGLGRKENTDVSEPVPGVCTPG
jgi:hypothetical protein